MTSPRKSRDPKTLRPATQLIHGGSLRSRFEETSEALFLTQGYLYDTMELAEARFKGDDPGFIYSRFANPTVSMFEQRMALLEGAEAARATASGMAAVTASLMGQLKAGDHIVAARALFGSCLYVVEELLPRFGVASTLVDGADLDAWRAAMRPNTKTTFLESPTNPTLEIVDIAAVAEIMHRAGATLVVDNVFATPLLQQPMKLGADCVVYSATKHIDGQGRVLGGVILARRKIHRRPHSQFPPPDRPLSLAFQRLGDPEVAGDADRTGYGANAHGGGSPIPQHSSGGRAHPLSGPRRPSASRARGGRWRLAARCSRSRFAGGKAAAFAGRQRAVDHRHFEQSRRRQEPDHPPETTTHQRLKPEQRAALGIGPRAC
jgi:O-succinylhomoserine sulfhydrylase